MEGSPQERTGVRIIGQVAGHEIHFEIEDVLDKKMPNCAAKWPHAPAYPELL